MDNIQYSENKNREEEGFETLYRPSMWHIISPSCRLEHGIKQNEMTMLTTSLLL